MLCWAGQTSTDAGWIGLDYSVGYDLKPLAESDALGKTGYKQDEIFKIL